MDKRRIPLVNEEPKHKKKSATKGLSRSKHKHQYETVLLSHFSHTTDAKTGTDKVREYCIPTKVCMICGRVDHIDRDPLYYVNQSAIHSLIGFTTKLSEKALSLPRWYIENNFDKFAKAGISEKSTHNMCEPPRE